MNQPHSSGNGSTQFKVHTMDMGGWVRTFTDPGVPLHPDWLLYLSHSLTEWFRQHPHLRLRCVAPMAKDGNTAELHAWYDQQTFPDQSGL